MTAPLQPTLSVLFICVHNAGKSQMAAALATKYAGDLLTIHSAGTSPDAQVSRQATQVIAEMGADMSGETPTPIDPQLLRTVDRVIVLGTDAQLEMSDDARGTLERWVTDEPSERHIEGVERMRLIRDDIDTRVQGLVSELITDFSGSSSN